MYEFNRQHRHRYRENEMKKIMLATDFSERSDRALRRATLLARHLGYGIVLVHVVDDDQSKRIVEAERTEATRLLQQTADTMRDLDGVECETRVILAAPFAGIVQVAAEVEPMLLVMGSHRRHILRDVFMGTTVERVIRSVQCPVLMANAPPAAQYSHLLLTTDLSECSRQALLRLPQIGIDEGARKSLLYVFEVAPLRLGFSHTMPSNDQADYLENAEKEAVRDLAGFAKLANLGCTRQVVRHEATAAGHEILKAAEEEQADLIVLSTHGRSGLGKMLLGSVTEQVLRTAAVDVLTIPPPHTG
jgi:nucleotide-binding universal stress UspA family protein